MTLEAPPSPNRGDDEIEREIDELGPWFHNLHLPGGYQTAPGHPLGDFPAFKWAQLETVIPAELSGVTVLDIGCNAGFYSFQLAARGAEVTALDVDERYLRQARWAARMLDPEQRVHFRQGSVYDLAASRERYDLVLFLGVLYHLRHPLLALDLVARQVRGRLILQTLTMPGAEQRPLPADLPFERRRALAGPGWPRAAFIEHSLAGDPTNWWAPDDACVRAMVRSAGLQVVTSPGHELYVCEPDPAADPDKDARREAELEAVLAAGAAAQVSSGSSQRK